MVVDERNAPTSKVKNWSASESEPGTPLPGG